ncbi:multidrug ABC transporter ATP-binding protein [Clostridium sporogenes]
MNRLVRFLKPYKTALIGNVILMFAQIMGTLYIPTLTASIVNIGIEKGNVPYIVKTGGSMLLIAMLTGLSAIAGAYLASSTFSKVGRDIRNSMFAKTQDFSINDFNKFGTASMVTRNTSDVTQVQQAFIMFMEMLLPAPVMIISGLILAFSKDRPMALIIIAAMFIFVVLTILAGKKAIPLFSLLQAQMDKINQVLRENISGIRVIRAFNKEDYERKRLNSTFTDYSETAIKVNKIFAVITPTIMLVMNLCTICMIWFGGMRVAGGFIQIGDIMALIEYSILILFYLIMGVMAFIMIPRAQACAVRIDEVLDTRPEIEDRSVQVKDRVESKAKLEFKNVTFSYPGAEEPVLSNLNFTCRNGETTAIIGGTGSGKSTIASLIMRFYDIQEGHILVDGVDIKNMRQKELRNKIGYVPQKAFLFSGTIADNLSYGNKDASMEELHRAVQIAQADDFISSMEQGYQSSVSQGGANYSGGQKQRLSIARALVKKPEIYMFDDSFSALDFKTDAKLRTALKKEIEGEVVIVIAQRISTIMDADQIIVVDNGRICGIGAHKELLKECKVYREIAKSQLMEEELS